MSEYRCAVTYIHEEQVRLAEQGLVDPATAERLAAIFQALADPTRVRMVSALARQELCVCDLAALLGMTQSAISHQLRILRSLDVVRSRKEGRIVYYALDDDHVRELFDRGLAHAAHRQAAIAVAE